jgi:hypothetical protein
MLKYLLMMLMFVFPHVGEPGEGDPDPEVEDATDDSAGDDAEEDGDPEPEADPESEAEPEAVSAAPAKPMSRAQRDIIRLRKETQELREDAKRARELAEQLQRSAPPPVNHQLMEEEQKLRDPATSEWERWQIQANRTLRQTAQATEQANRNAADMADKMDYVQKGSADQRFSRYATRVEQKLAELRRQGSNAPREVLLKLLIGEDALAGKFQAKPAAKSSVSRGKIVSARSDTPARGTGSSEHQKRAARLSNTII